MSSQLFSLKGKVALITGATNGIGLGMAKGLAEANIDQIILTYRSAKPFESAVETLKALNPHVQIDGIQVDLSEGAEDDVIGQITAQAYAKARGGKIDILINNAGISRRHKFEVFPQQDYDEVIRINLNIPVKLTKAVGAKMLEQGVLSGSIIFTASLMSFQGGQTCAPYTVAKGGINQFTKLLSNEWSSRGIRVNSIAPGYIQTNLTDGMTPEARQRVLPRIPMGRWGNMDDFKGPTVFLCSDAARYVTGETLLVDGGWMGA